MSLIKHIVGVPCGYLTAMEDLYKWRLIAGKIIYKWAMFHSYVKQPEGMY